MNANDQGVATRVVRPDARAAALGPGSGPAVTFATTEHFNLQIARAITVSLYERHHRRALVAYSPEAVDRAAISVSPSQPADAA